MGLLKKIADSSDNGALAITMEPTSIGLPNP